MFKLLKVGKNELGNNKREKNVDEKKKDNLMRNLGLRSLQDKS